MIEKFCGVYMIKNNINDKMYIGSSVDIMSRYKYGHLYRLRSNKHYNPKLQNAFNKYGESYFELHIIELCDVEELMRKEKDYILKFNSHKIGYNITEETDSPNRGKKLTEEHKRKIGLKHKNKIITKEQREKISATLTGRYGGENNPMYGKESPFKGKKHTEESKEKLKKSHLGKKMSEQTKQKLRKPNYKSCNSYTIISPDNDVFIVDDGLERFCDRVGVKFRMIMEILSGNISSYKGWRCYKNNVKK